MTRPCASDPDPAPSQIGPGSFSFQTRSRLQAPQFAPGFSWTETKQLDRMIDVFEQRSELVLLLVAWSHPFLAQILQPENKVVYFVNCKSLSPTP